MYYSKHYFIHFTKKRNKCVPDIKTTKQYCSASSTLLATFNPNTITFPWTF